MGLQSQTHLQGSEPLCQMEAKFNLLHTQNFLYIRGGQKIDCRMHDSKSPALLINDLMTLKSTQKP